MAAPIGSNKQTIYNKVKSEINAISLKLDAMVEEVVSAPSRDETHQQNPRLELIGRVLNLTQMAIDSGEDTLNSNMDWESCLRTISLMMSAPIT